MRWLVVLTPGVLGVLSSVLSPNENFRSSGLLAGVALSILLAGVVLAMRKPWRDRAGAAAVAARGGVALVLVVGLVGLMEGVPELLQGRFGLFVSADDRGLLAVAPLDGGFVAVGHPESAAAWTSPDGVAWTQVPLPEPVDGLELRALAPAAGTLWAVAQDETAAGLLVEVPGIDHEWIVGSRFVHEDHGQKPYAAAALDGHLLTFASTYGNDVIFFRGDPHGTLRHSGPEPAGDRGYSARDLACADDGCVAVGENWEPAAAIWHTSDGDDWERVLLDRDAVAATGVAAIADGWLAVGHGHDGSGVAWRSSDGRTWEPYAALTVAGAVFDGLAVDGDTITAFGHDTRTDRVAMWTLAGDSWTRIELSGPPGSRIRGLAVSNGTVAAVGVDGDSLWAAAWVSTAGSAFELVALEPAP